MTKEERDKKFPVGIYSNQWLEDREKQKLYWKENRPDNAPEYLDRLIMGEDGAHTENGLDPGVQPWVVYLMLNHVETLESCEGGEGHCRGLPWIKVRKDQLFLAYGLLNVARVPMNSLSVRWNIDEDNQIYEETGFIEFSRKANEKDFHNFLGAWYGRRHQ